MDTYIKTPPSASMVIDSTLSHHGVLGMKWGKRKHQDSLKVQKTKRIYGTENEPKGINVKKVVIAAVTASIMDDLLYDGMGKKHIIQTGRDFVTSYMKSKGATNIH